MVDWNDFYDHIAEKYETANKDDPAMPRKYKRRTASILRDLIKSVEDIRDNIGFNTNAPDRMHAYSKNLFEELKEQLANKERPDDLRFLRKAHFALFDKLDHMEALAFLARVEPK